MTNPAWCPGTTRRRRLLVTGAATALLTLVLACNRADGAAAEVKIDPGAAAGAPAAQAAAPAAHAAASAAAPAATEEPTPPPAPPAPAPAAPPAPAPVAEGPLDPVDAALHYARCIRANGYPEWPDPNADGQFMMLRSAGMSFNDPRRASAMEACQALRPPGMGTPGGVPDAATSELLYEIARCMRANGVPDFPDPSPGGGAFLIGPGQGLDVNSATFRNALTLCGTNFGPAGVRR